MRLSRQSTPLLAVLFVITLVLLLAVAGANGQSDEAIANFLRWLRENGADTNAVAWPVSHLYFFSSIYLVVPKPESANQTRGMIVSRSNSTAQVGGAWR